VDIETGGTMKDFFNALRRAINAGMSEFRRARWSAKRRRQLPDTF
jgi:hypothetical protein